MCRQRKRQRTDIARGGFVQKLEATARVLAGKAITAALGDGS